MLREIRDLGFEYAELSHGVRVSLVPGIIDAVEAGVIKISTLHNFCPLPMGVNHAAPNLFKFSASEKRERDLAWKHSMKTIETAERLGAKLIVLHSGAVDLSGFFGDPHFQDKLEALAAAGKQDSPKYVKLMAELEQRREARKEQPMELAIDMIRRLAGWPAKRTSFWVSRTGSRWRRSPSITTCSSSSISCRTTSATGTTAAMPRSSTRWASSTIACTWRVCRSAWVGFTFMTWC